MSKKVGLWTYRNEIPQIIDNSKNNSELGSTS